MKKIALFIVMMFASLSLGFAMKEPVVDEAEVEKVIVEAYPHLVDYYEAGVVEVESMTEETLIDGSREYNIRYKFVNSYYDASELDGVLKKEYPWLYRMNEMGIVKVVCAFRYVDKESGEIKTHVAYKRNMPERRHHHRVK